MKVIETWQMIDRWWTSDPVKREFVVADWYGRPLVFVREEGDIFRVRGVWK